MIYVTSVLKIHAISRSRWHALRIMRSCDSLVILGSRLLVLETTGNSEVRAAVSRPGNTLEIALREVEIESGAIASLKTF